MKEEEKKEKEKTASPDVITIRKDSLWKYSTFILVAILIVGAFVLFMEKNNSGKVVLRPTINMPIKTGLICKPSANLSRINSNLW